MRVKTNIRFDRQITVENLTETQDAFGELDASWSTFATVYAFLEDRPGVEKYEAAKETAFSKTFFLIRYRSDLTEKMRVLFEGKYYDIISIEEITRRRYTRLITELRE